MKRINFSQPSWRVLPDVPNRRATLKNQRERICCEYIASGRRGAIAGC